MRTNPTRHWSNLRGSVSLEAELEIRFLSSGSHTPMSMYGGPDQVGWEEQFDEERLLEKVVLTIGKYKVTLPKEVAQEIFEEYRELVDGADVEEQEER